MVNDPTPMHQDGTKSAESLVNQEAIASLIKRVDDLEKRGELLLSIYRNPEGSDIDH